MEKPSVDEKFKLSVIVVIVSDTMERRYDLSILSRCLNSLYAQIDPPEFEIIVPYPSQVASINQLVGRYPKVKFVPIHDLKTYRLIGASHEHHDELRARGIAIAKGEIIALIEEVSTVDERWSMNLVQEHLKEYAGVGGAIENGIDRPLNWGVYFCDFGRYQNPVVAGETSMASDANISYKAAPLMAIKHIWQGFYREPEINWSLRSNGQKIVLSPDIVLTQYRSDLKLRNALKERYIWGRSYAALRIKHSGLIKRIAFFILAPFLTLILTYRMAANVIKKGRNGDKFIQAFPLVVLLLVFWSYGEMIGYLTARPANI
jgi:hypothetical protein